MKASMIPALLAAACVLPATVLQAAEELPGHQAGSQYTATFHQHSARWQLTPAAGEVLSVSSESDCGPVSRLPAGVWLLTRDAEGRPELTAPSAIDLPPGHPGQVRLVGCGEVAHADREVAAPSLLLELLTASTGAVRIDD